LNVPGEQKSRFEAGLRILHLHGSGCAAQWHRSTLPLKRAPVIIDDPAHLVPHPFF
jgi:hypothetical protein